MGYQVYETNDRWQGYGVPAYCDVKGCFNEIDRGLGYIHTEDDEGSPSVFCCEDHRYEPLNNLELDNYFKEHPEWTTHILTHKLWKQWREDNPEEVEMYRRSVK
jgi:hypothetical protein